ncbi:formimidoylglutamate deiminase [Labrenzia aggregata]|uniref:Formimidoylglutamate deiminase n=1 Tax=Roseibium aggregatum TaxID=187304 RepID=A0A926SAF5_9HYPH|nr:formimidoylglutamate deiminase [Roseibium aggregatum]
MNALQTLSGSTAPAGTQILFADNALAPSGWKENVRVVITPDGKIAEVSEGATPEGTRVGTLLPAPVNLHSHAFQRAMAGMSERRGSESRDTFWTWRQIMFRFLDVLTPDDIEAIAAFVQMEMLEAGYAAVAEFHYVHHQPGGTPYDNIAELSERIVTASSTTGIGLTLLPVLYSQGGCDGRSLGDGQIRFGNDFDRFQKLHQAAARAVAALPEDARIGVAPHSLRAVTRQDLARCVELAGTAPLHMHLAEQVKEVEEIEAAYGKRPVNWLLDAHEVTDNWCLIHCTQMTAQETSGLAATGAVAGLCPITESSLGDGIFDGVNYLAAKGKFGIGSDSNIRISLSEELRTFEYSQRLRDKCRASVATPEKSTGRVLYETALAGGAQAAGRASGALAPGRYADLLALDGTALDLDRTRGDETLDIWVFAGDDRMVADVWSAGRHVVTGGRHRQAEAIRDRYRTTMRALRQKL